MTSFGSRGLGEAASSSCPSSAHSSITVRDCSRMYCVHVVRAAAGLAGRARALPAAEGLHARPRARGRAGAAVHVDDARLDPVEPLLDLGLVLAVEPGRQAVLRCRSRVRCPRPASRRRHRDERNEQLLLARASCRAAPRRRWASRSCPRPRSPSVMRSPPVTTVPFLRASADGLLVGLHRGLVDDRAQVDVALQRVADLDLLRLGLQRLRRTRRTPRARRTRASSPSTSARRTRRPSAARRRSPCRGRRSS